MNYFNGNYFSYVTGNWVYSFSRVHAVTLLGKPYECHYTQLLFVIMIPSNHGFWT